MCVVIKVTMLTSGHLKNMVTCDRQFARKWSHISCFGTVTISDSIPLSDREVFIHGHKYNLSIEKLTAFSEHQNFVKFGEFPPPDQ